MDLIHISRELMIWKIELRILPDSGTKKKLECMGENVKKYRGQILSFFIYLIENSKREDRKKWRRIIIWKTNGQEFPVQGLDIEKYRYFK